MRTSNLKRQFVFCGLLLVLVLPAAAEYAYFWDASYNTNTECGGVGVLSEEVFYNSNTQPPASIVKWTGGVAGPAVSEWINAASPADTFTISGGTYEGPRGIALDSSGCVYLSAYDAGKPERAILVFDRDLNSTDQRLILDATDSIDYRVYGIALDAANRLYVLYYSPNHDVERVKVFDASSTWSVTHIATPLSTLDIALADSPPHEGICVNSDGSLLWVSSRSTRTVGRYVGSPGVGYSLDSGFALDLDDQTGWEGFKGMDLSADEARLFIADDTDGAERILIVDATTGAILPETFSTTGEGATNPFDVKLDPAGSVYVAQYVESRVEKHVWQEPSPTPTPGPSTPEVRALWVTRWDYTTPADVASIATNARNYNFNILLFQVRGNATTFYQSSLEPWAWELTGSDPSTLGTDPGWNPLAVACAEAHARGMELHAYMNVFPAWKETIPPPPSVDQLWNTHNDWFMQDISGNVMWPQGWWDYWYTFIDPGVAAVKQYLHDVFLEVVTDYAVDGLHYDYIRYPYEVGDWAYNATSVARFEALYGAPPGSLPAEWREWKRMQITEIVDAIYPDAEAANPQIKISAAVVRSWSSAYTNYAQDYRAWLSQGILDMEIPMLYIQDPVAFTDYVSDHLANCYGRWVIPGLGAHNTDTATLLQLIDISRTLGAQGVALFSYSSLFPGHTPNSKADALLNGPFHDWVEVPEMPWKGGNVAGWRTY